MLLCVFVQLLPPIPPSIVISKPLTRLIEHTALKPPSDIWIPFNPALDLINLIAKTKEGTMMTLLTMSGVATHSLLTLIITSRKIIVQFFRGDLSS